MESGQDLRALMRGALVVCQGRRWLVTYNDERYQRLFLRELPASGRLLDDDFSMCVRRVAKYPNVTPLGVCHPYFLPRIEIGYAVVATELGPAGPQHVTAYVSRVEGEYVWYWRADGVGRQQQAIRSLGFWLTSYADDEKGRTAWLRDETRYAERAAAWWRDGVPGVYDYGLQRLARRVGPEKTGKPQRVFDLDQADGRPEPVRTVSTKGQT